MAVAKKAGEPKNEVPVPGFYAAEFLNYVAPPNPSVEAVLAACDVHTQSLLRTPACRREIEVFDNAIGQDELYVGYPDVLCTLYGPDGTCVHVRGDPEVEANRTGEALVVVYNLKDKDLKCFEGALVEFMYKPTDSQSGGFMGVEVAFSPKPDLHVVSGTNSLEQPSIVTEESETWTTLTLGIDGIWRLSGDKYQMAMTPWRKLKDAFEATMLVKTLEASEHDQSRVLAQSA